MWLGKMASAASIPSPLPPGIDNLWTKAGAQSAPQFYWHLPCSEPLRKRGTITEPGVPGGSIPNQFSMYSEYLLCSGLAQMLEAWKKPMLLSIPPSRVQAISGARNAQEGSSATRQSWLAPYHVHLGATAQPGACCPMSHVHPLSHGEKLPSALLASLHFCLQGLWSHQPCTGGWDGGHFFTVTWPHASPLPPASLG